MTMRGRFLAPLLAALCAVALPAQALEYIIPAQGQDHPGFGRVLFDVDAHEGDRLRRDADQVTITFGGGDRVGALAGSARNVRAFSGGRGQALVAITPGAAIRWSRIGTRVALDVLDPPAAAPAAVAEQRLPVPPIPPRQPPPASRALVDAAPPPQDQPAIASQVIDLPKAIALPQNPATTVAADLPVSAPETPLPPVVHAGRPPELGAQPIVAPDAGADSAFVVPFEPGVAAAAFRRPGMAFIVFDQRRPIDLAGLRAHSALAGASIQLLPSATLLRLPLGMEHGLALARTTVGWSIARRAAHGEDPRPITVHRGPSGLTFKAAQPGAVVVLADPETGAPLLVGTLKGDGQAMAGQRLLPGFALPPTWLGLVVEPQSDALSLRPGKDGFLLAAGADGLPLDLDEDSVARVSAAGGGNRRFDFPALDTPALLHRLRALSVSVANRPPLARGPGRRELAQGMLALGLAAEALTVLQAAAADDPREAEDADHAGLTGVAAVLAGRWQEAGGLDDARLDGDEIRLWRALRAAARQPATPPDTASLEALGSNLPILLAYPAALRTRVLPLAAEALLGGGHVDAARRLLVQAGEIPGLAYARALLLQADGEADKAAEALAALAAGADRLHRVRAAARMVNIRHAAGTLTAAQAAEALEKLVFAWRGDALDLGLRLQAAELRGHAGNWRQALALLRDTEAEFPDETIALRARMRAQVADMLRADGLRAMPPLDIVTLAEENADLLAAEDADSDITARLVERLAVLDLPRRATPLLRKLQVRAPPGATRARYGASLAALRLREADAQGALSALSDSNADNLPPDLAEERAILSARATARAGDVLAATTQLANLTSDAALSARAGIHEDARDWPRAAEALATLLARSLPGDGALDDRQQRAILRLATAASQADDAALLARLRAEHGPRMPPGAVGDLFRLLTAEAARDVADLPRTARELALARAISAEAPRR